MSRRHRVKKIKLSRTYNQRKALIKGLLVSLIETGKITTTLTKAKITQSLFDKLAVKAQKGSLHHRRQIASTLSNTKAANKLVDTIAPLMPGKIGGYTSIKKTKIRRGDASIMATLSLSVPLPEPKKIKKDRKTKKGAKFVKQLPKKAKKSSTQSRDKKSI